MEIKFQTLTNLLHVAGLNLNDSKNIAQLFLKWLHSCGPSWTNSRWKDLRQWYETYLTGNPVAPEWFAKTKKGLPKGPLGAIFRLQPKQALLALSINTLLISDEETQEQKAKFRKGLDGNGFVFTESLKRRIHDEFKGVTPKNWREPLFDGKIRLPDLADLETGKATVPVSGGKSYRLRNRKDSEEAAQIRLAKAMVESWKAVPEVTMEFLWNQGHLDWIPWDVLSPGGYQLELNSFPKIIGRIGHIQEPQMKQRTVASPNLVTQVTLMPLGDLWYSTLNRLGYDLDGNLHQPWARDCYRNQDAGIKWVQNQLQLSVEMAGTDLSSATDLLDLDSCIEIINTVWFPHLRDNPTYIEHVNYFKQLARSPFMDNGEVVSWKQGQPMGLYPSFALLALTNNAIARMACLKAGCNGNDYAVIGDDYISVSKSVAYYQQWIESIGGEINHSKTLTSCKVAEFAGRLIFPDQVCLKATKLDGGISDDNFMAFMATVGKHGKYLLKPRQRRAWEIFRFIPGYLSEYLTAPYQVQLPDGSMLDFPVPRGPFSQDGFGEPLSLRYEWYLSYVYQEKETPDRFTESDAGYRQLKMQYILSLSNEQGLLPSPLDDLNYQFSETNVIRKGDPRKWMTDGKTLLEVLECIASEPNFMTFTDFKKLKKEVV
jgi:hypothetical protein